MRVVLTVAASKHTGAAAVAELTARALRGAGVEARLLYRPGRNLEARLAGCGWAHPVLAKERSPGDIARNLAAVRRLTADADLVVTHLPHDHLLAVLAGLHRRRPVVRSFRRARHLRRDPWHRALARPVSAALLAHRGMAPALGRLVPGVAWDAPPVPLDDRFRPGADGAAWRGRLGIPAATPVVGMVGKLARGRGFELGLESAARLPPGTRVLVVGHGELQPTLEALTARLGLQGRVAWAGYRDEALPALYAMMDVAVFVGAGSDHGHRMISEAQGCARPVVAVGLPGVRDLVEHGVTGLVADPEPPALAAAVGAVLGAPGRAHALAAAGAKAAEERRLDAVGPAIAAFLERVVR